MNKIILITGCSSGLGKITAEFLERQGHIVYAGMRKREDCQRLLSVWKKTHPQINPVQLDITNDKNCKDVVRFIIKQTGKIDVLINNAGNTVSGPITDFSSEEFIRLLNTNTVGAFRLIKEIFPYMQKEKSGHIVNITSLNGLVALPHFSLYCSSKFALEGMTRSLGHEFASDNIKTTNIEPGAVRKEQDGKPIKKFSHTPARERFWFLRVFLPIIKPEIVAREIVKVVEDSNPPSSLRIGRDAKLTIFLQRVLPESMWNRLVRMI